MQETETDKNTDHCFTECGDACVCGVCAFNRSKPNLCDIQESCEAWEAPFAFLIRKDIILYLVEHFRIFFVKLKVYPDKNSILF